MFLDSDKYFQEAEMLAVSSSDNKRKQSNSQSSETQSSKRTNLGSNPYEHSPPAKIIINEEVHLAYETAKSARVTHLDPEDNPFETVVYSVLTNICSRMKKRRIML